MEKQNRNSAGARNAELLEALKLELGMVTQGGYGSPAGQPWREPAFLVESPVCLNFGKGPDDTLEPCDRCPLMAFVPPEHRRGALPCYWIPLTESGMSLAPLHFAGATRETQLELLERWLRSKLRELEDRKP